MKDWTFQKLVLRALMLLLFYRLRKNVSMLDTWRNDVESYIETVEA